MWIVLKWSKDVSVSVKCLCLPPSDNGVTTRFLVKVVSVYNSIQSSFGLAPRECYNELILVNFITVYCFPYISSLGVDKVSTLTHTYPHKTREEEYSDHMQSPGWQPT